MRVVGTLNTKDNLCNYCSWEFATCPKATYIKFGNGVGNDNVIECSEFRCRRYFNNYPIVGKPELGIFKRAEGYCKNKKQDIIKTINILKAGKAEDCTL